MKNDRQKLFLGLIAGIAVAATTGALMGQGASQPVKSQTEYFVTGEGDSAHLWVREGIALRCVGHGECKAHEHDDHAAKDGGDKHGDKSPSGK